MKTPVVLLALLTCAIANQAFASRYVTSPGVVKTDTALNRPAPDFHLKDIDGKTVSLGDYKGKTLVIDFWATWCVPCRESFPAVKMVVEKYKNDPDVAFLFIDTREKTADYPALVRKFLKDTGYPFHVVFDENDADGKMVVNYKKYDMPGIPTKYFIDPKGIIRFQRIGYAAEATPEQTAQDIESLIEQTKKYK